MPITVQWDTDQKNAVRLDFSATWTWEEFMAALNEDDALFDSVDHTVHMILNAEEMRTVPPNPVARFRDIASIVNPRLGLLIVVGDNLWFQKLAELFYRVYGQRLEGILAIRLVSTLDEARRVIAQEGGVSRSR